MKQYLVLGRHGESEANAGLTKSTDGLYYSNSGSDPAVPLTALGRRQGDAVATKLSTLFPSERKIVRAFHNDYTRVESFAGIITGGIGYDVERRCDSRLNKRSYGAFWNLTYKGVRELHAEEWQRFQEQGTLHYRPPGGGENYPDVFSRVDQFIEQEVMPATDNLLIVTSSVVVLSFIRNFEQLSDEEVVRQYEAQSVPNAHYFVFCRDGAGSPWRRCEKLKS